MNQRSPTLFLCVLTMVFTALVIFIAPHEEVTTSLDDELAKAALLQPVEAQQKSPLQRGNTKAPSSKKEDAILQHSSTDETTTSLSSADPSPSQTKSLTSRSRCSSSMFDDCAFPQRIVVAVDDPADPKSPSSACQCVTNPYWLHRNNTDDHEVASLQCPPLPKWSDCEDSSIATEASTTTTAGPTTAAYDERGIYWMHNVCLDFPSSSSHPSSSAEVKKEGQEPTTKVRYSFVPSFPISLSELRFSEAATAAANTPPQLKDDRLDPPLPLGFQRFRGNTELEGSLHNTGAETRSWVRSIESVAVANERHKLTQRHPVLQQFCSEAASIKKKNGGMTTDHPHHHRIPLIIPIAHKGDNPNHVLHRVAAALAMGHDIANTTTATITSTTGTTIGQWDRLVHPIFLIHPSGLRSLMGVDEQASEELQHAQLMQKIFNRTDSKTAPMSNAFVDVFGPLFGIHREDEATVILDQATADLLERLSTLWQRTLPNTGSQQEAFLFSDPSSEDVFWVRRFLRSGDSRSIVRRCFPKLAIQHTCVNRCRHLNSGGGGASLLDFGRQFTFTWIGPRNANDYRMARNLRRDILSTTKNCQRTSSSMAAAIGNETQSAYRRIFLPQPSGVQQTEEEVEVDDTNGHHRRMIANAANPLIVVAVRTRNRRHVFAESDAVQQLAHYVFSPDINARDLIFAEHPQMTLPEIAELHSKADILIGQMGSALTWTLLQPKGGVLVEFVGPDFGCTKHFHGWNQAKQCEYGGLAAVSHVQHLVAPIPKAATAHERLRRHRWNVRQRDRARNSSGTNLTDVDDQEWLAAIRFHAKLKDGDFVMPVSIYKHVIERSVCALRAHHSEAAKRKRAGDDDEALLGVAAAACGMHDS